MLFVWVAGCSAHGGLRTRLCMNHVFVLLSAGFTLRGKDKDIASTAHAFLPRVPPE